MKVTTSNILQALPMIAVIALVAVQHNVAHADATRPALTAAGKNPPQSYFDKQKRALRAALSK